MPTFDATPGGAAANSYATVAEATDYHASRLYSTSWTNAVNATREAALMMAARLLDASPKAWTGSASTETQALGWPRTGMLNRNGFAIAVDAVPKELKEAQAEFARQLIDADRTVDNSIINKGISSIKAGSVQIAFENLVTENSVLVARSVRELNALAAVLPDAVKFLLVPSWLKTDPEDLRNTLPPIFDVI
jgi:DnaT-like ssDNA binding protein